MGGTVGLWPNIDVNRSIQVSSFLHHQKNHILPLPTPPALPLSLPLTWSKATHTQLFHRIMHSSIAAYKLRIIFNTSGHITISSHHLFPRTEGTSKVDTPLNTKRGRKLSRFPSRRGSSNTHTHTRTNAHIHMHACKHSLWKKWPILHDFPDWLLAHTREMETHCIEKKTTPGAFSERQRDPPTVLVSYAWVYHTHTLSYPFEPCSAEKPRVTHFLRRQISTLHAQLPPNNNENTIARCQINIVY